MDCVYPNFAAAFEKLPSSIILLKVLTCLISINFTPIFILGTIKNMRDVVIVSALRTAIGAYGKTLKDVPAVELGAIVIKEAVKRANINPYEINEVIFGNVLQAGLGQNPARQAAVKAGLPVEIPAFTINKVCGSGLRSISLAAQIIKSGDADTIVVGGMENMSSAPFLLDSARWGQRMGHGNLVDEIVPVVIKTKKGEIIFDQDEFPRFGNTIEALKNLNLLSEITDYLRAILLRNLKT